MPSSAECHITFLAATTDFALCADIIAMGVQYMSASDARYQAIFKEAPSTTLVIAEAEGEKSIKKSPSTYAGTDINEAEHSDEELDSGAQEGSGEDYEGTGYSYFRN
ncbi:hypothetical protein C8F04DRAFT_1185588 [Mycena alexandri]|uniref:Uncharacterized protein n=1 Tax=Mycena alexandri TaxID=1745969 RepID=A0AAD6SPU0_9AGAR|nr:hypothetical protein C8F04DRAFT_1185588 [Mycena alexandri]